MASSTSAPSRPLSDAGHKRLSSFPSRQRRMGPAPLASFEDLSMDKTNSDNSSSPEEHKVSLSEIGEEGSSSLRGILSVPTSPKIRIEAASSPSQHESDSKESTPEKEHFTGYKKEEFFEEMSDLRLSTEELDAEEDKARKKRLRAQQIAETERRDETLKLNELIRKGSSSSVISDGLLPVTSGHSSRLSSLGSIGSPARRSPSPHKMLLETSFCGNKPIQHPSIDIEDPPIPTSEIMQFAIEKLETIKSPLEAKPPDIFRSTSPVPEKSGAQETLSAQTRPSIISTADTEFKASKTPEATICQVKSREALSTRTKPPTASTRDMEMKPFKVPEATISQVKSRESLSAQNKPITFSIADTESKFTKMPDATKSQVKGQEPTKSLQRRQEQQRRQAEHHEYYQRHVEQVDVQERKISKDTSSFQNIENTQRKFESQKLKLDTLPKATERQSRLEKRQTGTSPRSPRLGKKVPTPQVPELKDLPRTSPSSPASSLMATTPDFHTARSSRSTTPAGSPKSSGRDKANDKDEPIYSLVRKGSLASMFRKSDSAVSPVTPDSPGSSSGRKSPFSQFIRNAENKFRSRSRSRSRSKSRDRELEDDTHDRRKVLSIFMPSKKKKKENEKGDDKTEVTVEDQASSDLINSVEFKFNAEGTYQSSSFGLIRQESEVTRAIKEPLRGDKMENGEDTDAAPSLAHDTSLTELSSYMNDATKKGSITENFSEEVTKSLKAREEELKYLEKSDNDLGKEEVSKGDLIAAPPKEIDKKSSPILRDKIIGNNLEVQNDQDDSLSISESDRGSEIEYLKKKEKVASTAHIESPDNENKGLVSQDSFEDEELPFVPTTLPQERSIVPHIIPVKERVPKLKMTQSIDRPRSTTPIQPSRLEEYKQSSQELLDQESDKLTISIKVPQPGAVKVLPTRSPRRQGSKSWEDFCSEGLKSPRQLRRQYREKQQTLSDGSSSPPPPPPPPPANWKSPTKEKARSAPQTPRASFTVSDSIHSSAMATPPKWINFDEMPSIVLKPVRKIKTVPQKRQQPSSQSSVESSDGKEETPTVEKESVLRQKKTTPKRDDSDKESSEHSSEESEDEKPTSVSSSEELSTVRETIEKLKKNSSEDTYENSDLERLLAPVNECISKLSSLASSAESHAPEQRRSPIPDNWEDFLLPPQPGRRSRLSSLGSDAGSLGMRSPSPSVMLLETSFCGSQPIDDPALAEPDVSIPVARKLSGISLGDLSPLTPRGERASLHSGQYLTQPDRASVMSDSSAEGGSPKGSDYDLCGNQRGQHGGQGHLNPFGMDLEVKSNRSSIVSQDQSPPETSFYSPGHRA